jgi:hypothetical protein
VEEILEVIAERADSETVIADLLSGALARAPTRAR